MNTLPEQVEVVSAFSITPDEHKIQPFIDNVPIKQMKHSVNKSKRNTKRNISKKCPKGQRRNPITRRCRKRCSKGRRRSITTRKCVKSKK
jgi:hypothetical protein